MAKSIFINLPVRDLTRSIEFYRALGFALNPDITDDKAACIIIGENIFAMLLTHERFADFTTKPIADAKATSQALLAIEVESREAVDELVQKAIAAGGHSSPSADDYGWMYSHDFEDLDGHQWGPFWSDPKGFSGNS